MANFGNTRMDKRKNPHETKAEPPKKALKKNELLVQHKALEQRHEALEQRCEALEQENKVHVEQQKKNLEVIHLLEETVNILELNVKKSKVEKKDAVPKAVVVAVQTEDMEIMRCNECEYPAEDIYDLGEHLYEIHTMENESSKDTIACYYCDEQFETKSNLMNHRKKFHIEKVNLCSNFTEGNCHFAEECWYNHSEHIEAKTYKCSFCEQIFKHRSDFMHHKKKEHSKNVPICKNAVNEICHFGRNNCWFNHGEIETFKGNMNLEHGNGENKDMIAKLFDMVEKFTQRIVQLESKM